MHVCLNVLCMCDVYEYICVCVYNICACGVCMCVLYVFISLSEFYFTKINILST